MVRLEPPDFSDPARLAELAAQTNLEPGEFRGQFEYVALA